MTADFVPERRALDIGRVMSETVQVAGRNIVVFSILGLVLAGLPAAVVGYLQVGQMRDQLTAVSSGNFNFSAGYFEGLGVGGLTALITNAILQGALIYATVQDLNGQKASVGDSLATGLRNFLPLIGVTILFVLAFMGGTLLLIVPGFMIACAWCVVAPALVADRTGVFGAFSRSAELTRGNRWRIFGLAVLLWIVLVLIGVVFSSVLGAFSLTANPAEMLARVTSPLYLVATVIEKTVVAVISSTLVAVLYVELRRAREGAGPEWLADVFS